MGCWGGGRAGPERLAGIGAVFGGVPGAGLGGLAGLVQYGRVLQLNGAEGAGWVCNRDERYGSASEWQRRAIRKTYSNQANRRMVFCDCWAATRGHCHRLPYSDDLGALCNRAIQSPTWNQPPHRR